MNPKIHRNLIGRQEICETYTIDLILAQKTGKIPLYGIRVFMAVYTRKISERKMNNGTCNYY